MVGKDRIRNRLYQELITAWKDNNYLGFSRLAPGTGKSLMIINIIKEHIKRFSSPNIIILVSSRTLRDKTFIDEVNKWWMEEEFFKYCTIECYQTQMNISGEKYTLGIADEGDVLLSTRFLEGYSNNSYDEFICLSGTFNKEKRDIAAELFGPMLLDYPVSLAQEEGLLNKTKIILYPVPLDTTKNIRTKTGFWSESVRMKWIDDTIQKTRAKYFILKKKIADKEGDVAQHTKDAKMAWAKKEFLESGNSKSSRMNVLYTSPSTIKAAKSLKLSLLNNPDNKVLVFSERTANLDIVCGENVFYGNKSPKKIDAFNEGKIRELGATKKVERGYNFVKLNHTIMQSFSGSESRLIQQLGRLLRLDISQEATAHYIVSYYTHNGEVIPARNHVWFKTVCEGLGMEWEINKTFM